MGYAEYKCQDFDSIRTYNKFTFAIQKRIPFWDYVGRDKSEFLRLSRNEKEKVYLRWRYGLLNSEVNKDLEQTDNFMAGRMKEYGIDSLEEGEKEFWKIKLAFHEKCQDLKKEIGLGWTAPSSPARSLVEKVVQKIDWND